MIGFVQGGLQALSRSYYTRLIPHERAAEFFGFYNMLGKFAVIIGPLLVGFVGILAKRVLMIYFDVKEVTTQITHLSARFGIASILILFILGAILFYFVDEKKGKMEIEAFNDQRV